MGEGREGGRCGEVTGRIEDEEVDRERIKKEGKGEMIREKGIGDGSRRGKKNEERGIEKWGRNGRG